MYTMLVAVDGFEHSEGAVRHAIDMARRISDARVVLVNVQPPPMSGEVSALVSAEAASSNCCISIAHRARRVHAP